MAIIDCVIKNQSYHADTHILIEMSITHTLCTISTCHSHITVYQRQIINLCNLTPTRLQALKKTGDMFGYIELNIYYLCVDPFGTHVNIV